MFTKQGLAADPHRAARRRPSALRPYEAAAAQRGLRHGATGRAVRAEEHTSSRPEAGAAPLYDEVVRRGWFRRSPQRQRAGLDRCSGCLLIGGRCSSLFCLGALTYGIDARRWDCPSRPGRPRARPGRRRADRPGARQADGGRTAEGSAVLAQSEGFKQYLETAEADQIRFEEAQDVFSRYLPYAIVFGVADRWAAAFEEVAEAAAAGTRAPHLVRRPHARLRALRARRRHGLFATTARLHLRLHARQLGRPGSAAAAASPAVAAAARRRRLVARRRGRSARRVASALAGCAAPVLEGVLDLLAGLLDVGFGLVDLPSASRRSLSVACRRPPCLAGQVVLLFSSLSVSPWRSRRCEVRARRRHLTVRRRSTLREPLERRARRARRGNRRSGR